MKKSILTAQIITVALVMGLLGGCGKKAPETPAAEQAESVSEETEVAETEESSAYEIVVDSEKIESGDSGDITIVYTSDVHSYIDNVVKDADGKVIGDGLRFSKITAMVQDMKADGGNVILVDAGDEFQGDIYGAIDEGANVVSIMNATGYNLATPGNHDFDYGMFRFFSNVDSADFQYISCNFHATQSREIALPAGKIFEIAGKKVAFVGVTTPETFTKSTPTYFQNEAGEFIYAIEGTGNADDLYVSVQNAIDNAKKNADYVIALGHTGVGADEKKAGISCEDIIANTSGLDAYIGGHSHTSMEAEYIKDKSGREVLLTQAGSYLQEVGIMTISEDGSIQSKLVTEYDREDEQVAALEQGWIAEVENKMGEKIGELDSALYVNNPDEPEQRLIRARELNLGDFTADSVYWFFNEKLQMECDAVLQNGGGIRAQIEQGDLTYMSAKQVEPFGNMVCLISASGQQIIDALEMGATLVEVWDDEWNAPMENGGFMQVAGLIYTIDSTVESSVKTDSNGMFVGVDGEYRVRDVKIYNREKGVYEDIDPDRTYHLGGINYLLRNGGNGLSMFEGDELDIDYVGQDYVILSEYILNFAINGEWPVVNTMNSPLSSYDGYLIDYENPYGAGRISIILE